MKDEKRPPGRETRRAGTPPQSASPDHVNRPHPDNTTAAAPEGAAGNVVAFPRQPLRWAAVHFVDETYAVVFDTIWRRRPFPIATFSSQTEAQACLRRMQRIGLPLYAPPFHEGDNANDPEAA